MYALYWSIHTWSTCQYNTQCLWVCRFILGVSRHLTVAQVVSSLPIPASQANVSCTMPAVCGTIKYWFIIKKYIIKIYTFFFFFFFG